MMYKNAWLALAGTVVIGGAFAEAASAIVLQPPGHTWEYTFTDPTGDPDWNTTTGVGGTWRLGDAPFSNVSSGDFARNTLWPAGAFGDFDDDLWVRTTLDLTNVDLATVLWDLGVDNGYKLYANGNLVSADNAEGFTSQWEYSGNFGNSLVQGVNIIAAALEDHGVLTAFDMQITGEPLPEPVPEPMSALPVLAIGAALAGNRLKKKQAE